ncbi:unnamed protein product [Rotaria sp. Silwood1]|nr:unnamed protein product [Rotaria sp. Silwood1]CAF3871941.1 unnamed protein product [Rotaria sp. Silwood1]CAF3892188.1 unnamed protein product [Rotaria sp. Silwood1]CAF4852665.1 unnamed protein product [Rotaria sp. Silwood1]
MSDKVALSLLTLPVELIFRFFDELNELTIFLYVRKTLTILRLHLNEIHLEEIVYLINNLQNNKTFQLLDLEYNEISAEKIRYLINELKNNEVR